MAHGSPATDDEAVRTPDITPGWHEAHRLDAVFPGPAMAMSLMISLHPGRGHAAFHGCMVRLGEAPIVVVEFDVPPPTHGWEVRASGLWADHVCETPLEHWSYGLEAFGLAIDDPAELLGAALGDRTALGWELEFEARAEAQWTGRERYGQIGSVHGLMLEKHTTTEVDGYGIRSHWWGTEPPSRIDLGDPQAGEPTVIVPDLYGSWTTAISESGVSTVYDADASTGT